MKVPVIWYLGAAQWDTALPKYILQHAAECEHFFDIETAKDLKGPLGVIVIPGRHSAGQEHYLALRKAADYFEKVVFIIIGDEEGIFHADEIRMEHAKTWWLMPAFYPKQQVDRVGPNGWPTDALEWIAEAKSYTRGERPYDWSFMGQMTHLRRVQCVDGVQGVPNGKLLLTQGFTQGAPRTEYYATMVRSKIVLCPSGPCTPDSFRFCEALEAGCVPIVDGLIQHDWYPRGYWEYIFHGGFPFPIVHDWNTLPEVVGKYLDGWKRHARACAEWWAMQKQRFVSEMREDLKP